METPAINLLKVEPILNSIIAIEPVTTEVNTPTE